MKLPLSTFGPVVLIACAGHHHTDLFDLPPPDAGVDAPTDAQQDHMNDMDPCYSCSPPWWCDWEWGWQGPPEGCPGAFDNDAGDQ